MKFENPYTKSENTIRVSADADRADVMCITGVHPERGILQTAVNLLMKSIADECRRNNWIYTDGAKVEAFILRRCAPPVSAKKADVRNDGRRA